MPNNFESILRQIAEKFNLNLQLKDHRAVFTSKNFSRLCMTAECLNDNLKIIIATIIGTGAGGTDFNRILFPKLLNSLENINRINEIYHGCIFQRCVRLNTFKTNLFFHIADFFSIEEYLKIAEFVNGENAFNSVFKRHYEGAQLFSSIQHKKFRWRE